MSEIFLYTSSLTAPERVRGWLTLPLTLISQKGKIRKATKLPQGHSARLWVGGGGGGLVLVMEDVPSLKTSACLVPCLNRARDFTGNTNLIEKMTPGCLPKLGGTELASAFRRARTEGGVWFAHQKHFNWVQEKGMRDGGGGGGSVREGLRGEQLLGC